MSSPDGVLEAIDSAVRDWAVGPDAMRSRPAPPVRPQGAPVAALTLPAVPSRALDAAVRDWTVDIDAMRSSPAPPARPRVAPAALTVSLAVRSATFVAALEAAKSAFEAFGRVYGRTLRRMERAVHVNSHRGDRRHRRRCPTCNPAGFAKPLPVNGREYARRRRTRRRR